MSFQAYLDALETKTGKTPRELLAEAATKGFDNGANAAAVAEWLRDDYGVGRGHGMAFFHVLKNGATIIEKHVGTTGSHRDASTKLQLDGIAARQSVMVGTGTDLRC
jgi:hypothetical protein